MSCENYKDFAILYAYDELNTEDKEMYEHHLAHCSICRSEIEGFRQTHLLYQNVPEENLPMNLNIPLLGKAKFYVFLALVNKVISEFSVFNKRWFPSFVTVTVIIFLTFMVVGKWDFRETADDSLNLPGYYLTDFDLMLDNIDYEISNVFAEEKQNLGDYLTKEAINKELTDKYESSWENIQVEVEILSWEMKHNYF